MHSSPFRISKVPLPLLTLVLTATNTTHRNHHYYNSPFKKEDQTNAKRAWLDRPDSPSPPRSGPPGLALPPAAGSSGASALADAPAGEWSPSTRGPINAAGMASRCHAGSQQKGATDTLFQDPLSVLASLMPGLGGRPTFQLRVATARFSVARAA